MLNKVLYYGIVYPLSKLPLGLLYGLFTPFYVLIFYVIGYRKQVIKQNIQRAFPDLSANEHAKIVKSFYRYLTCLLAESIKNLSISESELRQRMKVENPELMDQLYAQGKNVILLSAHYNNWELLITAQNLLFKHQAIGIGMPLSNSFWDKKLNTKRERFGMKVVNSKNYKSVLNSSQDLTATLVLGDQSPSNIENVFWTHFLHQTTPFYFGAEIMANQMNQAVVYAHIHAVKRGYYNVKLSLITDQPQTLPYGNLTQHYIDLLNQDIQDQPERWLWSHKRWKINIPEHLEALKANHRKRFEAKFRS